MMKVKLVAHLSVGIIASFTAASASAQVATKGLPPAANTLSSFVDASIVRDSRVNQPLDLLNDFYPAIEVTIAKHDNIRRRSDIEENDLKITLKPSLAYRTNFGRHQFYAAYRGVFTYHDDFDQEDAQANSLAATLGLDLSRRWDLNVFAGVGKTVEERGVSGSRPFNQLLIGPDRGPDDVDYTNFGADLIYGRKVSRLNAVLGFDKSTSDYTNNFQGDENPFSG
ncbi:MAG: outer membrane beta-barrel protein, partial [Gammaproteobacteria bacterium]|nr:outer membrane beta-barrel protein [Gammaproteobacteria bacterium]